MTKELTIQIKVGDWEKEYLEIEEDISNEQKMIDLVTKKGLSTSQAGRLAIVARERKEAPEDILPANKPLLNAAAAAKLSLLIAQLHKKIELENGNNISVREYVAPVREEDDNQKANGNQYPNVVSSSLPLETFVSVDNSVAFERAIDYLLKRVPGYIMGRLEIIAYHKQDVRQAAEQLKAKIDEMVMRLE